MKGQSMLMFGSSDARSSREGSYDRKNQTAAESREKMWWFNVKLGITETTSVNATNRSAFFA